MFTKAPFFLQCMRANACVLFLDLPDPSNDNSSTTVSPNGPTSTVICSTSSCCACLSICSISRSARQIERHLTVLGQSEGTNIDGPVPDFM